MTINIIARELDLTAKPSGGGRALAFNLIKNRLGFGISAHLNAELKNRQNGRASRRGHNDGAWIRFDGAFGSRQCRLLDVSRTGIRLTATNADEIPEIFVLLLSKNGTGCRVRVKWRRGTQIGAEFVE